MNVPGKFPWSLFKPRNGVAGAGSLFKPRNGAAGAGSLFKPRNGAAA